MLQAVEQAEAGKTPFGCVIVRNGQVIARAYNTVRQDYDPSAHGELNAIRRACRTLQRSDLPGAVLYTTGEPCPMCMAVILYAGVARVVIGATIQEISQFMPQIPIPATEMKTRVQASLELSYGVLHDRCLSLLRQYA